MSNIFNHNRFPFQFKLDKSEYWDLFLSADNFGTTSLYDDDGNIVDRCLISYIDTNDADCVSNGSLHSISTYSWENSVNNGLKLENIGFTGIDNGLITFDKDTILNKEFHQLFSNSVYEIGEGNTSLILNKVDGNNKIYDYPTSIIENDGLTVSQLNGGFYQGFYKSGCDYEILPHNVGSGLCFEFVLKKDDTLKDENSYILNDRYPDNKGIFFYIGTRAENKWWRYYDVDTAFETISHEYFGDDYISDSYLLGAYYSNEYINSDIQINQEENDTGSDYFGTDYVSDDYFDQGPDSEDNEKQQNPIKEECPCQVIWKYPEALNTYQQNSIWRTTCGGVWIENEKWTLNYHSVYNCNDRDNEQDPFIECLKSYVEDNYFEKDMIFDPTLKFQTKDGIELYQANIHDITSDNKFLLFDRTCKGFTVDNWVEGTEVTIRDVKSSPKENYFLLFNRTCNGYTVDMDIKKLLNNTYNVMSDVYRNAFALQIKDDGSLGYKYIVKDCDSENDYKILSEFSYENIIPENEWVIIHVRVTPLGVLYGKDALKTSDTQKIRLMFYVNGRLVMVSKELPTFNFRELNDTPDKQESVPFNISLGGGTQSLCDVIYYDYKKTPNKVLPIEKEFAGSFIGYFKSFKMYDCRLDFSEITQNYMVEKKNIE